MTGILNKLRETVVLRRWVDRSAVLAKGPDRGTWLNGLLTCDLLKRAPGHGSYGLIVQKNGKIVADLHLLDDGQATWLFAPVAEREAVFALLDAHLIMEDAAVELVEAELVSLHGPFAAEVANAIAGSGAVISEVEVLGRGDLLLSLPASRARELGDALGDMTTSVAGVVADDATWDTLRVDRFLPSFGIDYDQNFYPQEAALELKAVSFEKGCYLGQEVVYMLEKRGHVKRRLTRIALESGEALAPSGSAVADPKGDVVGETRSGSLSERWNRPVMFAVVKRTHLAVGTELQVRGLRAVVLGSEEEIAADG